jgi:hypothetical protein
LAETHTRRTSLPLSARKAVCFGFSDFSTNVFGIVNVLPSGLNVNVPNRTF